MKQKISIEFRRREAGIVYIKSENWGDKFKNWKKKLKCRKWWRFIMDVRLNIVAYRISNELGLLTWQHVSHLIELHVNAISIYRLGDRWHKKMKCAQRRVRIQADVIWHCVDRHTPVIMPLITFMRCNASLADRASNHSLVTVQNCITPVSSVLLLLSFLLGWKEGKEDEEFDRFMQFKAVEWKIRCLIALKMRQCGV